MYYDGDQYILVKYTYIYAGMCFAKEAMGIPYINLSP
jgi:hypothetical protein